MCGGMAMADVRDRKYEVNRSSEREEMPNQVVRRSSRMEWSRVSKGTDGPRRQKQETRCLKMALVRWSCNIFDVASLCN